MILRTPRVIAEKKRAAREWEKKYKEKTTIISQNVVKKAVSSKTIIEQDNALIALYKMFNLKKDYKLVGAHFYINKDLESYSFEQIREKLINKQKKFEVYKAK